MTNQEIVRALRCTSTVHAEEVDCSECPFRTVERVPEALIAGFGCAELEGCDSDRICQIAAERLEREKRMANSKRLIDANEIEELFYKQVEYGATDMIGAFDDALQDSRSVSAVEVVRCKDYKHNPRFPRTSGKHIVWCRKWRCETKDTDFCSYGRAREMYE